MRARQVTSARWFPLFAGIVAIVVLAGCGRVDLEDLTPEAFKTQQALDAANQPTATSAPDPNATADPDQTPTTVVENPLAGGDVAAGASIYNSQCSGCHESDRAATLQGKVFDPAVEIPKLRTADSYGVPHPVYGLTDIRPLNDNDLTDVFAFLATQ